MGEKRGMKALEIWCRRVTDGYPGVKVDNMTTSWRDGLAFCALIHHFRPDLIDFDRLDKRDILKNNGLAFRVAERQLGIPALLDPEDMLQYEIPDRLSILTYLSQFYQVFSQQGGTSPSPQKHSTPVADMLTPKTPTTGVKVGRGRIERCWTCERPVFLAERLVLGGKVRHRSCFTCARCGHQLNPVSSYETESGDFVCEMCPDEEVDKPGASELDLGVATAEVLDEAADIPCQPIVEDVPDPPIKPPDPSKTKFLSDILNDPSEASLTLDTNIEDLSNVCVNEAIIQDNSVQLSESECIVNSNLSSVKDVDKQLGIIDVVAALSDNDRTAPITENIPDNEVSSDNNSGTERIVAKAIDSELIQDYVIDSTEQDALNNGGSEDYNKKSEPGPCNVTIVLQESSIISKEDLAVEIKEEDVALESYKANRVSVKDRITALENNSDVLINQRDSEYNKTSVEIQQASSLVLPFEPDMSCGSQSDTVQSREVLATLEDSGLETDFDNSIKVEDEQAMNSSDAFVSDNKLAAHEIEKVKCDKSIAVDFSELNRRLEAVSQNMGDNESATVSEGTEMKEENSEIVAAPTSSTMITVTDTDSKDYPKNLNPFGDSDDEEELDEVTSSMTPVPAVRSCKKVELNNEGKTIIEVPQHLNPFWSDDDSENEVEEPLKPLPAPRNLRTPEPLPRNRFGSSTSLTSQNSSSGGKKKKRPAPQPPRESILPPSSSPVSSLSSPSSHASRSPAMRRRKSRPAPPPPIPVDKERKDQENKVKQNLSPVDKSMYGKWKRKKGAAPAIPVAPQKRRIVPLVPGDVVKEVFDLEVQQGELERQGVELEQTIRRIDEGEGERDIEDLVLQLFEIVNRKNELFRRQAELMYLRRQQRLEEEQADLEYQIRCLMSRNKSEADPGLEEELIARLLDVVERRNEIVDCLEMNRKRQIEEDQSINDHLQAFSMKDTPDSAGEESSGSKKSSHMSVLKMLKKKKKKEKKREAESKDKSKDADVDIDESVTVEENEGKAVKTKKKWFTLDK